jgi:hypothetical protein
MLANNPSADLWRMMDDLRAYEVPSSQAMPEAESDPTFQVGSPQQLFLTTTVVDFGFFLIS